MDHHQETTLQCFRCKEHLTLQEQEQARDDLWTICFACASKALTTLREVHGLDIPNANPKEFAERERAIACDEEIRLCAKLPKHRNEINDRYERHLCIVEYNAAEAYSRPTMKQSVTFRVRTRAQMKKISEHIIAHTKCRKSDISCLAEKYIRKAIKDDRRKHRLHFRAFLWNSEIAKFLGDYVGSTFRHRDENDVHGEVIRIHGFRKAV